MTAPTYASGLLFTKAHKLVRAHIYELLEKYELNPTSWSILGAALQAPDGIRLTTLAEMLGVKPPMVTILADELIGRGLVLRAPHPTDGRVKLLMLTPKGRKLALLIETELSRAILELLNGLSPGEILIFQKALETIIRNAS